MERLNVGRRDGDGGVSAVKLPEEKPIEVRYVGSETIDQVWNDVFHMVEPACDETITPRDVYDMICENKALVWLLLEDGEPLAAAVTRQHARHGNTWLDVITVGGRDWHKWAPVLQFELERHAEAIGVDAITAHVRRGLTKWLARLGWRERQVHMEYRIDGR